VWIAENRQCDILVVNATNAAPRLAQDHALPLLEVGAEVRVAVGNVIRFQRVGELPPQLEPAVTLTDPLQC
jgi:hypothetical protein